MPTGPFDSLTDYIDSLSFTPDPFQRNALASVSAGTSVVVTAPTGAGKTVIGEGAIVIALAGGRRAFYTTPIKALSNQKYGDLIEMFGTDNVGLLTGDNVINGDAPVVVMTTEVLRNMIYEDSPALTDLGVVVLDEVHYLADRDRGSVWEEVIIHLPEPVLLVALSATIANPEQFTEWVRSRRGDTDLVVETIRPVPLTTMYAWRDRHRGGSVAMLPMFSRNGRPNPTVSKIVDPRGGRHQRVSTPRRTEIVHLLNEDNLLPVIYFVFSRKGCDQTAQEIAQSGFALTSNADRRNIRRVVEERTSHIPRHDLTALEFESWLAVVEQGVASHHAGLVPAFKETIEALFVLGLVQVVVATETLSVGINMPARTVVLDSLSKFNGESHELLEPSDFTQLTGRAGRRGIDTEGSAVVLYSRYVPFDRATRIAGSGANTLSSSFAPSYNMAVNLIARYSESVAKDLLAASFANFEAASRRSRLEEGLEERRRDVDTFTAAAQCERGDVFAFYDAGTRPKQAAMDRALLEPGAIVQLPDRDLVLVNRSWGGGRPRLVFVDIRGTKSTIVSTDLPRGALVLGTVNLPTPVRVGDAAYRKEVGDALERFVAVDEPKAVFASDDVEGVAGCPDLDAHVGWVDRALRAQRDLERLQRRISTVETDDITGEFERRLRVLSDLGYIKGWSLRPAGDALRRIYNPRDLLLSECMRRGLLSELDPGEFASALTVFTFETRGGEPPERPTVQFSERFVYAVESVRDDIARAEFRHGVDEQTAVDPGFMNTMYGWAAGHDLVDLFDDDELRAGDFVRSARQLLDLLRQLRDGFPDHRTVASQAMSLVDRGIVELGGIR
jgi:ATP-dependent RNA helicase HelY